MSGQKQSSKKFIVCVEDAKDNLFTTPPISFDEEVCNKLELLFEQLENITIGHVTLLELQ